MPRSRKSNRVPVQGSGLDDSASITSAASTNTLPPHRRQSSVTSTPTTNEQLKPEAPPHLRTLSSQSGATDESTASRTRPEKMEPAPPKKEIPLTNFARNNPFACSFPDCSRVFKTLGLLKQHKASDDAGHDYCKICDMDFQDDDALHLHKIGSERHICCEVCSEDFSSESGRDRHMRQVWTQHNTWSQCCATK